MQWLLSYGLMLHYKETERECICRRVAPDYAADLSVPILDCGRNAKERDIGSSTVNMSRPHYKKRYN